MVILTTIGGGGNLAFGGSVGVISTNNFTFNSAGLFPTESMAGASAPNITSYSNRNTAGTYSRHTLTLRFNKGETRRLFFCYLGKDKRVLRIGGSNYRPSKK